MSKGNGCRLLLVGLLSASVLMLSCAPAAPAQPPRQTGPTIPQIPSSAKPEAGATSSKKPLVELTAVCCGGVTTIGVQTQVLSKLLKDHSDFLRVNTMGLVGYAKCTEYYLQNREKGYYLLPSSVSHLFEYATGTGTYKGSPPRKDLGLLWVYSAVDLLIVARTDSGVKTGSDLKGKKIGINQPGSIGYINATRYLKALGFKEGDFKPVYGSYEDLVTAMKEGTIQVWMNPHTAGRGQPYPYLEDLAGSMRLSFVSVVPAEVDKMNTQLGTRGYVIHTVPGGLYKGQTADVSWLSEPAFQVIPSGHSEDIGYELCRVWWDFQDEAMDLNVRCAQSEPDITKDALAKEQVVPFHPGALKYYRQRGWIK